MTGLSFWRTDKPRPMDAGDVPVSLFYAVGTDYFSTMGIPVRRGRSFTARDDSHGRPVMIVDEELARAVFPNEDPIGRSLHIGVFNQDIKIVGVAGHIKHHGLIADDAAAVRSQFYVPHRQLSDVVVPLLGGGAAASSSSSGWQPSRGIMNRANTDGASRTLQHVGLVCRQE